MTHENGKASSRENDSAWHFDPDWLISGDEDVLELEDISTCPSWYSQSLDKYHQGENINNNNKNQQSANLVSLIGGASSDDRMIETANEDDVVLLRNRISMLISEASRKEVLQRHLTAQNLALQNENSNCNRMLSKNKREIQTLNDHVAFLRHVAAPTPDAGALDVSLSLLRGHELERTKAKEMILLEKCDILGQQKRNLELELENERHARNSAETAFQNEIDRANQEISKLIALRSANKRNHRDVQTRLQVALSEFEKREKNKESDFEIEKHKLIADEIRKKNEMEAKLQDKISALEEALKKERENAQILNSRLEENQIQVDLAWAEVDGYRCGKKRQKNMSYYDAEIKKQNSTVLNSKRVGAPKLIQTEPEDLLRKDYYIAAMDASRNGLKRIIDKSSQSNSELLLHDSKKVNQTDRTPTSTFTSTAVYNPNGEGCQLCKEKEMVLMKLKQEESVLKRKWEEEHEKNWKLEKEEKLEEMQRQFTEHFKQNLASLLR